MVIEFEFDSSSTLSNRLLAVLVGYACFFACQQAARRSEAATTPTATGCIAFRRSSLNPLRFPIRRNATADQLELSRRHGVAGRCSRGGPENPRSFESNRQPLARQVRWAVLLSGGGRHLPELCQPVLLSSGPARCMSSRFQRRCWREAITQLLLIAMAGMTALLTSAPAALVMEGGFCGPCSAWQQAGGDQRRWRSAANGCRRQPQPGRRLQRSPSPSTNLARSPGYLLRAPADFVDGVSMSCVPSMTLNQWLRPSGWQRRQKQTSSTREPRSGQRTWTANGAAAEMIGARWRLIPGRSKSGWGGW